MGKFFFSREKTSSKQLNFGSINESTTNPAQTSLSHGQDIVEKSSCQRDSESAHLLLNPTPAEKAPTTSFGLAQQSKNLLNSSSGKSASDVNPFQQNKGLATQPQDKQQMNRSDVQNNSYRTPNNRSFGLNNSGGRLTHSGPTPNSGGRPVSFY